MTHIRLAWYKTANVSRVCFLKGLPSFYNIFHATTITSKESSCTFKKALSLVHFFWTFSENIRRSPILFAHFPTIQKHFSANLNGDTRPCKLIIVFNLRLVWPRPYEHYLRGVKMNNKTRNAPRTLPQSVS